MNAFQKWFQAREGQRTQDSIMGRNASDGAVYVSDIHVGYELRAVLKDSNHRLMGLAAVIVDQDGILRIIDMPEPT